MIVLRSCAPVGRPSRSDQQFNKERRKKKRVEHEKKDARLGEWGAVYVKEKKKGKKGGQQVTPLVWDLCACVPFVNHTSVVVVRIRSFVGVDKEWEFVVVGESVNIVSSRRKHKKAQIQFFSLR